MTANMTSREQIQCRTNECLSCAAAPQVDEQVSCYLCHGHTQAKLTSPLQYRFRVEPDGVFHIQLHPRWMNRYPAIFVMGILKLS